MYANILTVLMIFFILLETLFPWRTQRRLRPRLFSDLLFFILGGYYLGGLVYWVVWRNLLPTLARWLEITIPKVGIASSWPLWAQAITAIIVLDLAQWLIHNMLHRVSWCWEFHKIHHSVQDNEMDFWVPFRFHWMEAFIYSVLQLPVLILFGFSGWVLLVQAAVSTFWNFLNHANLSIGGGPWRLLFNNPQMHIWHHDANAPRPANFAIVFSLWDYLFKTAYQPAERPERLGFEGDTELPAHFIGMSLWPLSKWIPGLKKP